MNIKFIMLINVKMPPMVEILTFINMIDTTSESLKARIIFKRQHFSFMSIWNFILMWVEHETFYNLWINIQKSLKFRFTPSDYSFRSKWLPSSRYLFHLMGNLDCVRAVRMCRLFLSQRWKLSFIPSPGTTSSTPHTTFIVDFLHVISVKSCALAEIKAHPKLLCTHACVRTRVHTYIHSHLPTHVCTFYETRTYWSLF